MIVLNHRFEDGMDEMDEMDEKDEKGEKGRMRWDGWEGMDEMGWMRWDGWEEMDEMGWMRWDGWEGMGEKVWMGWMGQMQGAEASCVCVFTKRVCAKFTEPKVCTVGIYTSCILYNRIGHSINVELFLSINISNCVKETSGIFFFKYIHCYRSFFGDIVNLKHAWSLN